jgi:hypothetical protein
MTCPYNVSSDERSLISLIKRHGNVKEKECGFNSPTFVKHPLILLGLAIKQLTHFRLEMGLANVILSGAKNLS